MADIETLRKTVSERAKKVFSATDEISRVDMMKKRLPELKKDLREAKRSLKDSERALRKEEKKEKQ